MIEILKKIRRKVYTVLKLRPMHTVLTWLKNLGYTNFKNGLEIFGYQGWYHTIHYKEFVENLEVWEINPDCEKHLKKNVPQGKIVIGDSYELIRNVKIKYDLIVIDNHQGLFGNKYCEHFEIINDCFKALQNNAVLILNFISEMDAKQKIEHPNGYLAHKIRRDEYYGLNNSESISLDFIQNFYTNLAQQHKFIVKHSFIKKRNYLLWYLVLCVEK